MPLLNSNRAIRVLVVDDSAVVRRMIDDHLNAAEGIEVVGKAADPYEARDLLPKVKPDVMTLDMEMPRMDGLTFLRLLMEHRPMPVVVLSSLTQKGSHLGIEALRIGAVEVLGKPGNAYSFDDLGPALERSVRAAACARVVTNPVARPQPSPPPPAEGRLVEQDNRRLILLGASTGGTEALREVIQDLRPGMPPIVVVQHIPAAFSAAFADRLNDRSALTVREATDGELCLPDTVLIAPGNRHLTVKWAGNRYRTQLSDGPQVWHQRPAVDVLFRSIPPKCAPWMIAGVLTGMGKDGAQGLVGLREQGARTFAQDEATCVVYGMPREAWEQGGAAAQVPLPKIASHLNKLCNLPAGQPSYAHA